VPPAGGGGATRAAPEQEHQRNNIAGARKTNWEGLVARGSRDRRGRDGEVPDADADALPGGVEVAGPGAARLRDGGAAEPAHVSLLEGAVFNLRW
jgi:hypothetical protein